MNRTKRTHAVLDTGWAERLWWNVREGGEGLLLIAVALALWAWVVAGVMAPLGHALARMDVGREPAAPALAGPVQPGALASAAGAEDAGRSH
jgi:hypothetical protein